MNTRALVRVGQLACFIAVAWLTRLAAAQSVLEDSAPSTTFSLSILGENEQRDGSWTGVDLLDSPDLPTQRFQMTLRPTRNVRVFLDAVNGDGSRQRLFPALVGSSTLARGRAYALPAPDTFYELTGTTRLRLTVVPVDSAQGEFVPMLPVAGLERVGPSRYRLSDGSSFDALETVLKTEGPGVLEIALTSTP